ncbi:MAG: hypothetical protein IJB79_08565 [Candidatus Gastranaerophilales bacterium]|nr:hypothetical protein [Candidatus Gastranaerophilales bacterium]
MALITKISNVLTSAKNKFLPTRTTAVNSYAFANAKKQTFGYDLYKNLVDPDIVELSADFSQEAMDSMEEEETNFPKFNFLA